MWKPDPLPLRWPLTLDDGQVLKELPLRPILHKEHTTLLAELDDQKAARAANGDAMDDAEFDDIAFLGLATLATGQPENVILQMKRPDFNALAERVYKMVALTSHHFMTAEQQRTSTKDNPLLLVPLKASDGVTYERIELDVPDLMASRMMRRIKDRVERAEFITAKCTGLIAHDLHQLTVPDWNTLQNRVNDFLNETAESFPLPTSTSSAM